jgi:hypothetical protein
MIIVPLTDLRVGDFVVHPGGRGASSRVTAVHAEPDMVLAATIGPTTFALPWDAAKLVAIQVRDRRRKGDASAGGGRRADHAPWCEAHEPGGQCASQQWHVGGISAWITRDTPRSDPRLVVDGVTADMSTADAVYLSEVLMGMTRAMAGDRDGEEESADPPRRPTITPIPPLPESDSGSTD